MTMTINKKKEKDKGQITCQKRKTFYIHHTDNDLLTNKFFEFHSSNDPHFL